MDLAAWSPTRGDRRIARTDSSVTACRSASSATVCARSAALCREADDGESLIPSTPPTYPYSPTHPFR
ncbi:hypothetical protein ACFPRL_21090 [Pseudoclavibacter helvolus]